jgi:hypothetical protein
MRRLLDKLFRRSVEPIFKVGDTVRYGGRGLFIGAIADDCAWLARVYDNNHVRGDWVPLYMLRQGQ